MDHTACRPRARADRNSPGVDIRRLADLGSAAGQNSGWYGWGDGYGGDLGHLVHRLYIRIDAIAVRDPPHPIADNTVDGGVSDAIDLHGEGEHHNEIRGNTVVGVDAAGIALGNSGGEKHQHDASGEGNWVHDNVLRGNEQGVLVILGTPGTLIEDNEVVARAGSTAGIELRNAPGSIVRDNTVSGEAADFWGVLVAEDDGADGRGAGAATGVLITGNRLSGRTNGIRVEAGRDIEVTDNEVDVAGTPWRVSTAAEVSGDPP